MAVVVAVAAAEPELLDEGVLGDLEVGIVVVLEQLTSTAVDAYAVALLDQALLPSGGVAVSPRGVDRTPFGVVDQHAQERLRRKPLDDALGDRLAVIERAAVAPNVQDHFRLDLGAALRDEFHQRIRALLRHRRPGTTIRGRVRGRVRGAPKYLRVDRSQQSAGLKRRQPEHAGHHPVRVETAREEPRGLLTRLGLLGRLVTREPCRQCMPQPPRRNSNGDLAQLRLVLGRRHPRQRPNLAVRQVAALERAVDRRQLVQGPADPQPLACRAHLYVERRRDPVRAGGRPVARPLARLVELNDQSHQPSLRLRPVRTHRNDLRPQGPLLLSDRHPNTSARCSSWMAGPPSGLTRCLVSVNNG